MNSEIEDLLRKSLPNFMQMHDEVIAELHYLRQRSDEWDYREDEVDELKAEIRGLRTELDAMRKDREFSV